MDKEKICGIYKIENLVNGKMYIGLSSNIKQRWRCHKIDLNGNRHDNQYLQNAWNKYGIEKFKFEIIEECEITSLSKKEGHYILKYETCNKEKGYNMNYGGEFKLHTEEVKQKISEKHKGKILSDITKEKLSKANKGKKLDKCHPWVSQDRSGINNIMYGVHRYGTDSPHYGKTHTDESKNNMSINSSSLYEHDIKKIKILLKYSDFSCAFISRSMNVKAHQVYAIKYKNTFEHISIDNITKEEIEILLPTFAVFEEGRGKTIEYNIVLN